MLLWTRGSRTALRVLFVALFLPLIVAPLGVLVAAALAVSWNGLLPSGPTAAHLATATSGEELASALVSVQTAVIGSAVAVLIGAWGALAAVSVTGVWRRVVDVLLHLPVAVPSVVIGLGLLVAFSRPPLLLNGTRWIVLAAHVLILLPFAYSVVSAALRRQDPALVEAAASLGATPARVLLRVRLPLLLPALSASASLGLAMSMGEVGATIMLYPPDWRTLPVTIFALADRGDVFAAAASTVVLLTITVAGLVLLGTVRARTEERT